MCISALLGCCSDTGCSICVTVLQFLLHPSATFNPPYLNWQYGENGCITYFMTKSLWKICDHMCLCIGSNLRLLDSTGSQWMSLGQFFSTNEMFLFHVSFVWIDPKVSSTRTLSRTLFLFCCCKNCKKTSLHSNEKYTWRLNSCEHNVTLLVTLFTYVSKFTYM